MFDESRELGNMANPPQDVDSIYKALRLVPEFDGNPHILTRFINLCDQIVEVYLRPVPGQELQNLALVNGILNKITGPAARLINSNGIPETWIGIRNALINNFADHRDETALYSDLSLQTQGSSTPQEFYERCQNLFSTIMTYVSLHENVPTTVEAKRNLYQKLTLQAYLRGLKDPLGSRVRCMRPASMEKALEFVQEELNTLYMQQRNEGTGNKKDWQQSPQFNQNLPLNNFVPKQTPFSMPMRPPVFNMPGPSRQPPMPPQPHQGWRPNFPMQMQQPRGPTRTQQIMRAPPQNYNPQNNNFSMNRQPQQQSFKFGHQSRPMSGVSHFVPRQLPPTMQGHDWRRFGNPPPTNYMKSREVNFNECDYDYNSYATDFETYYPDYDVTYYPCDYTDYGYYPEPQPYTESVIVEEVDQNCTSESDVNFPPDSKSEKQK